MAEAARMVDAPARARRRGGVSSVAGCLALSALASVAVEWAGMTWWWPDEGAEHAARVLRREAGYLNADFRLSAARILGVDGRVGSVEVGKDADLALFDGDPFEYTTHVCGVVIESEVLSRECR